MGAVPTFSLIVCTLGRNEALNRLLTSLTVQDFQDFEVLIVDQAPAGQIEALLVDFAGRLRLRHIRSEPGLSRARNVGLRHARGTFLCFPDDDCWYPPDTLTRLAREFDGAPDLDLLLGKTVDPSGRDSLGKFRRKSGSVSKRNVWTSGNSNSIFVRRDLAVESGGFDETLGLGSGTRFQSGEETDFILRVLALGAVAKYDPEIKIYHEQVDGSIGQKQFSRAQAYSPGFGRVLRKHRYGPVYLVYCVGRTALRSLFAAAVLDWPLARYKMIWAKGTIEGYLARG
jgi:glycosyltransferase involved in cell wall biosynthesis